MKLRFHIKGLHCANCASKIEDAVRGSEGVSSAHLDFTRMVLTVNTDIEAKDAERMVQFIADSIEPGTVFSLEDDEEKESSFGIILTALCTAAFLTLFISDLMGLVHEDVADLLFIAIFLITGAETLIAALRGILNKDVFNEYFLMSVATVGAVLIGQYAEAAAVMVFFSVGELVEDYAVGSSRRRITELLDSVPETAHVIRDGRAIDVDPYDVAVGEHISVRPGERIPLDGIIVDGTGEIDTSMVTGESCPRNVSVGDAAISGSVNGMSAITVEVTRSFSESAMVRIAEMMESAGERKSQSERFITRFARYYTPAVCVLALMLVTIPLLLGYDPYVWVYRALTFLVISCPCALVISVPMTIMSGIGCASSKGILVKGGNYLEMLSSVDTIAFDKTGTLTEGRFTVTEVISDDSETLRMVAYALESNSTHPMAKAVCSGLEGTDVMMTEGTEHPGMGMEGIVNGRKAFVGNSRLMEYAGLDVDDTSDIGTVHVAYDGRYLGKIHLADIVREDAAGTISELRELGVKRMVMLTGDREPVAKRVSSELGMDSYVSEMLPEDKLSALESLLSDAGGNTVFVGDGINDGPSLRRADIGISIGRSGSDTALDASDVIISGDGLKDIPLAMRISRRTMSILKQNVILSLGIKVAVLVLTVVGLSNMWGAVIADVGACILAVSNSLRALRI
ncbi:MAG: heavy metal translocating P-type ATPase [Candidatus Methanomethylophilaceae archaeon]|nr:heavy metal translocating P-type ATPase [Candidatus Methanomethylophilaceae archaeon]